MNGVDKSANDGLLDTDKLYENKIKWINRISKTVFGLTILILCFALYFLVCHYLRVETFILNDYWALVGDAYGGVFGSIWALAGVVLFYFALQLQRHEMKRSLFEYKKATEAAEGSMEELQKQTHLIQMNNVELSFMKGLDVLCHYAQRGNGRVTETALNIMFKYFFDSLKGSYELKRYDYRGVESIQ